MSSLVVYITKVQNNYLTIGMVSNHSLQNTETPSERQPERFILAGFIRTGKMKHSPAFGKSGGNWKFRSAKEGK